MKSLESLRLATAAAALSLATPDALGQSQTLVQYDPAGFYDSCATVFNPTSASNLVSASPISQVGFGCWGNTNVWPVGQIGPSPVLDPTLYVTFDLASSTAIQYQTLEYDKRAYVGEGARRAAVRTSLDGFSTDAAAVGGLDPSGVDRILFDLTGLPVVTGPIEFRIYFFDAPAMGADWADLIGSSSGAFTGLVLTGFEAAGPLGTRYCGPAIPNSSTLPGLISGVGNPSAVANDVTLTASQLPAGQFGYFLTGRTQGFLNPPGSQGILCLQGNIGRYNSVTEIIQGPTGSLSIDLTSMPVNPPIAAVAGETWNFQCWFRDNNPTLTSNFTDGLTVTFL